MIQQSIAHPERSIAHDRCWHNESILEGRDHQFGRIAILRNANLDGRTPA